MKNMNIVPELSTSDHKTKLDVNLEYTKMVVMKVKHTEKGNYEKLRGILSETNRSFMYHEIILDAAEAKFKKVLNIDVKLCIYLSVKDALAVTVSVV